MKKLTGSIFGLMLALSLVSGVHAGEKGDGGWFKNFFLESDDGNYKVQLKGRLQTRFSLVSREDTNGAVASDDAGMSFMVRRAYLTFVGHVFTPKLTYDLTLNGQGAANNVLEYGWMNYEVDPAFQVKAGLHKVVFNRQEITSSGKQQFIDRSLANERFNLDRSIGLVLWGTPFEKKMEWYLSAVNGRGTRTGINANNELGFTARLVWNPLGEYGYSEGATGDKDEIDLTLGIAGTMYHEETTVSATQDRVLMGNADFGLKYKGFSTQGEVFFRNSSPRNGGASTKDLGAYVQAGYFLIPKHFEIAGRASALFDDIGDSGTASIFNNGSLTNLGGLFDGVDENSDADNEYEFSLALNYYINGTPIKVQGQYSFVLDGVAGTDDVVNHIGMVQAQLEF